MGAGQWLAAAAALQDVGSRTRDHTCALRWSAESCPLDHQGQLPVVKFLIRQCESSKFVL